MKPHFHKVPIASRTSFSIRHDKDSGFGTVWHYHPELELHYLIKGTGVRFIGDNISNFSDGELILLGENLPHTWRVEEGMSNTAVEVIIIHFLPNCLGSELLLLPEAYQIPKLYEKARRGLLINGKAKEGIIPLMKAAVNAQNLDRLIALLSILKILAEASDLETIASAHAFYKSNDSETLRLNKIYAYTLSNYRNDISLQDVASIANLGITSFCRYFKLMTKKTYNDFLVEIRISQACRFLIEDKLATEVICFECGFNNVSNFYRHFKKVTDMTPLEYKRRYLYKTAPELI
ncbi:AraC family transcriptional regulator [Dyadobacter fanqingshengii]|uniref:AraC family transcriptional regulator n=1 Tax=Dyadobacter fanqingshengii TaxID=2906443 RepID=A0A9X1P786_9BACT|nr:AraC family transcriptional regulator [Dyadobacter fanqingshengii]MCF0038468.1 AraC family transcriptional regulator [Dyadobacter fanqingshengii]MCF2504002.1 AraC family transcriptional regulator [Dyadobacter fanqingshengii]USJ34697.1 AraC family transcriptional regulator [Dyadobacter fanqingshengii]